MARLFKIGDKVRCHLWHNVAEVTNISDGPYPILVTDKTGTRWHFILDGRYMTTCSEPTLRHAETGAPAVVGKPPVRFEYPIYCKSLSSDAIVEFVGLTRGKILVQGRTTYALGEVSDILVPHTNTSYWRVCDKPAKWVPTKPTWCWVWEVSRSSKKRRLVIGMYKDAYSESEGGRWPVAEPCSPEDIPDWWPKEWI